MDFWPRIVTCGSNSVSNNLPRFSKYFALDSETYGTRYTEQTLAFGFEHVIWKFWIFSLARSWRKRNIFGGSHLSRQNCCSVFVTKGARANEYILLSFCSFHMQNTHACLSDPSNRKIAIYISKLAHETLLKRTSSTCKINRFVVLFVRSHL